MSKPTPEPRPEAFPATRWSRVVLAGDASSEDAHEALAGLCRDYWRPLYFFARRGGHRPEDAQDLTQGFILKLLESNLLANADPNRGRFRTFLLAAFCNYLANEHRARTTAKRGGNVSFVELDAPEVEAAFLAGGQSPLTPEREFDRRWALSVLERVMIQLRNEYDVAGRRDLFAALQPHLSGAAGRPGYAQLGAALGLSESAVTVAMHRMRKRYGELLRAAITSTVAAEQDVEGELRHLIAIISDTGGTE